MKPRGIPSRWVKILPWYYTERRQVSRAAEREKALAYESNASTTEEDR